jgi:hypothetical protein
VKTGPDALAIAQANYMFDDGLTDPDALLDRYFTLTGWSEALLAAGAGRVTVVQRFHRRARVERNGVTYLFTDEDGWRFAGTVASVQADVVHVNGLIFPARTWLLRRALPARTALVVQNHSDGGVVGRAPRLRLVGRAARGAADA